MGSAIKAGGKARHSNMDDKGAKLRQACLNAVDGDELAFIEGHDDAILGLADVDGELRVVYGHAAIVRKLMARDGMDRQGAKEFVDYNIMGTVRSGVTSIVVQTIRP